MLNSKNIGNIQMSFRMLLQSKNITAFVWIILIPLAVILSYTILHSLILLGAIITCVGCAILFFWPLWGLYLLIALIPFQLTFYETALRLGADCKQSSPGLALYLYSGVRSIICFAYLSWVLHLSGTSLLSWIAKIKLFLIAGIITGFLLTIKPLCSMPVHLVLNMVVLASFAIYFIYGTMREIRNA